jgi:hypothetical protein
MAENMLRSVCANISTEQREKVRLKRIRRLFIALKIRVADAGEQGIMWMAYGFCGATGFHNQGVTA